MDTWKIVHKIANIFGIIFVVFIAVVAIVSYEMTTMMYLSPPPAAYIGLTIVTAVIPYIVAAVLSFTVAFATAAKASQPTEEKEPETQTKLNVEMTPP
jgi:hypothetical protein